MRALVLLAIAGAAAACGSGKLVEVTGVVRDARTGEPIANARVRVDDAAAATTNARGQFSARGKVGSDRELIVEAPGRCPSRTKLTVSERGTRAKDVNLFPRFEVGRDQVQVGFEREVTLEARLRCDPSAQVSWRQLGGPRRPLVERNGGRRAVFHTHSVQELVGVLDPQPGVIAFSHATRGEYVFEASASVGGRTERARVRVTAAPLSTGVFQVATGGDVYLNGGSGNAHDWTLMEQPEGSQARLASLTGRVTHFRPDNYGQYLLQHVQSNTVLNIQAGPYDRVPRDCGREPCHQPEDRGWATTAHSRTFERGLRGELGAQFDEQCWSCHVTGDDPGVHNGGMHEVARELRWTQPPPGPSVWDDAPRQIRRHGSVWCSACHGPGRIIPPEHRWQYGAKFEAGLCARCHENDPHRADPMHPLPVVTEWRNSVMSHFTRDLREDDPALRAGCASCHSAQGFVEWRRRGDLAFVPDRRTVTAITCATCHDAHDGSRPHGVRMFDTSEPVGGVATTGLGTGAVCVACHRSNATSARGALAPHAPQADVMFGRGARTMGGGGATANPHAAVTNTCAGCHMVAGNDPAGRLGGHSFELEAPHANAANVLAAACTSCHSGDEAARVGLGTGQAPAFESTLAALRAQLRARVAALGIADRCASPNAATGAVVDHDGVLVLAGANDLLLGDCDGNGRFGEDESPVTIERLPVSLRNVAWDVELLGKDGSRGLHNPEFTARLLVAITNALRR